MRPHGEADGGMNTPRRWTQTDIAALRNRLQASGALVDVAGELDREPADVAMMISRLGLRLSAMATNGPVPSMG